MEKFRKNIVGGAFIIGKKAGFDRFLCDNPESIYGKITGFLRFSGCWFDAARIYAKKFRFFKVLYRVWPTEIPRARAHVVVSRNQKYQAGISDIRPQRLADCGLSERFQGGIAQPCVDWPVEPECVDQRFAQLVRKLL